MQSAVDLKLVVFCLIWTEFSSSEIFNQQSNVSDNELKSYSLWQLKRNAYVIAELEAHLVRLKAKLVQLLSVPTLKQIYGDIAFRVGRLEGTGCNSNELQCGGNSQQCVSDLLSCDGIKDCRNGKDEDESFCDTSILKPGTTYTVSVPLRKCIGGARHGYSFRIQIRTLHRSKIFPSRLTLTEYAQGSIDGHLAMITVTTGEFRRGIRRWRSYTPDVAGLWSECIVPEGGFERLHCYTFKGNSNLPCIRHFVMDVVKPHS